MPLPDTSSPFMSAAGGNNLLSLPMHVGQALRIAFAKLVSGTAICAYALALTIQNRRKSLPKVGRINFSENVKSCFIIVNRVSVPLKMRLHWLS